MKVEGPLSVAYLVDSMLESEEIEPLYAIWQTLSLKKFCSLEQLSGLLWEYIRPLALREVMPNDCATERGKCNRAGFLVW